VTEADYLRTAREAYDDAAVRYTEFINGAWRDRPFDLSMFAAFAQLVQAGGGGPVADLGCGPGHLTAHLKSLGLDVFGVDLSPAMVGIAREANPGLRFDTGSITALDLDDGSLAGVLSHYSTIHTPPELLPKVLAEFHRVLAPGGYLHLAFLADRDASQLGWPYDHTVSTAYRWSPDRLRDLLHEAGLLEAALLLEEPRQDAKRPYPGAHLLARKPKQAQPARI
jgi:SAM-dependent methyltransferase